MADGVSKLLRFASVAICLIALASFVVFAVNQTSTASGQQQEILNPKAPAAQTQETTAAKAAPHESALHRRLDEASEALSSPVSGVASSEWAERALRLLFVLLVFGFALGYLARVLRVRA